MNKLSVLLFLFLVGPVPILADELLEPFMGTWEYRQSNSGADSGYDSEGERLVFENMNGELQGVYHGLEREGEHGLFYSVVEVTDIKLKNKEEISFTVPARRVFCNRPKGIEEAESIKQGCGFTSYQLFMEGKIDDNKLIITCDPDYWTCPDKKMVFRKGTWSLK